MKNLTKQTIANLSKLKANLIPILDSYMFVRSGWLYRTAQMKYSSDFVTLAYKTDLPDCVIPIHQVKKIIDKLKSPVFSYDNDKLTITDGDRKFTYTVDSIEEAPVLTHPEGEELMKLEYDKLLGYSKFCTSDELRPAMQNVSIGSKGMCATNAHYMRFDKSFTCEKEILIPQDFVKLFSKGDVISVFEQDGHIFLQCGDMFVTTKMCDEKFPDWPVIIPDSADLDNTATIASKEFQEILELASTCANEVSNVIYFNANKVLSQDIDTGSQYIQTTPDSFAFPYPMATNINLFLHILKEIPGEVQVRTKSSNHAFVLNDEFLLMPCKILDMSEIEPILEKVPA